MDEIILLSKKQDLISVDSLHHRYLPKITPLHLFKGSDPMHISKSPHVKLLRHLIKHGFNWRRLRNTKYVIERRHRFGLGMTRWTDDWIKQHVRVRWNIFKSLEKNGYDKKKAKARPIIVLEKPLIETRFSWDSGFLNGPEVYDGFGRSSSAFVLGWEKIPAVIARDAKPGTMEFSKGFNKIKKVRV